MFRKIGVCTGAQMHTHTWTAALSQSLAFSFTHPQDRPLLHIYIQEENLMGIKQSLWCLSCHPSLIWIAVYCVEDGVYAWVVWRPTQSSLWKININLKEEGRLCLWMQTAVQCSTWVGNLLLGVQICSPLNPITIYQQSRNSSKLHRPQWQVGYMFQIR